MGHNINNFFLIALNCLFLNLLDIYRLLTGLFLLFDGTMLAFTPHLFKNLHYLFSFLLKRAKEIFTHVLNLCNGTWFYVHCRAFQQSFEKRLSLYLIRKFYWSLYFHSWLLWLKMGCLRLRQWSLFNLSRLSEYRLWLNLFFALKSLGNLSLELLWFFAIIM